MDRSVVQQQRGSSSHEQSSTSSSSSTANADAARRTSSLSSASSVWTRRSHSLYDSSRFLQSSSSRRGSIMSTTTTDDGMHAGRMDRRRSSSTSRTKKIRYDVTTTMERLRSDMMGSQVIEEDLEQEEEEEKSTGRKSSTRLAETALLPLSLRQGQEESVLVGSAETTNTPFNLCQGLKQAAGQIPAILLIGMFHMMIGIPFGVSYFPIGWSSSNTNGDAVDSDGVSGPFPLPGKEALGIRMFLFSTIVGQVVFTFMSGFPNPIGLQMVENVPFCHELSKLVINKQGYGADALSTIFVLFGIASILVGVIFYWLGRMHLGRVVYYFPTHVLVGCIGGIGLYIAKTGIEVTMNASLSMDAIVDHASQLGVVVVFEVVLRILQRVTRDAHGKPRFSLLSPIYFCLISPIFYAALAILGVELQTARDNGYFFPSLDGDSSTDGGGGTIFNGHVFDLWTVIDLSVVSWSAIASAIPTLMALILFSLIHVPINIPAFAISTNTEADMNKELVAHGYSNLIAGLAFSLQNYMAYTQSVLYYKSGGTGKASGMAVAALTGLLFFVGPTIASFIPRCMAGTLLLHVGIDLFLEGVYDSYGKFDALEYAGIWLITIVMTLYGMDAAMVTGVITAITTYVVQNMTYVDPVRGSMSATTLRSSQCYNRDHKAQAILDNPRSGRSRILVVQLQGHLFFGNIAHLTQTINQLLGTKVGTDEQPLIVIMDFSLVLGIDSSAAQAMSKLKSAMQREFHVELSIFVSGSTEGFPCQFDLSEELSAPTIPRSLSIHSSSEADGGGTMEDATEGTRLLKMRRVASHDAMEQMAYSGSHVCITLDQALVFAENYLVHKQDRYLLDNFMNRNNAVLRQSSSMSEEKDVALMYLKNLCPGTVADRDIETLFSKFTRETYHEGQILWQQGSSSDCMKLLVRGELVAMLENEAGTSEIVECGNTLGELGLIEGVPRMSSVQCLSHEAILYSLNRESYLHLAKTKPQVARLLDLICIRYLSARVQLVSNRIFETRCLPI